MYGFLHGWNISFLWDKCRGMQLMGKYMVSVFLFVCLHFSFLRNKLFSRVAMPFYLHSHQQRMRSSFSATLLAFGVATIFNFSFSNTCYRLNDCIPCPNSYVEIQSPMWWCLGWGFWEVIMSWRWSLMNGISAFIKRGPKELLCPFYHVRTQSEVGHL